MDVAIEPVRGLLRRPAVVVDVETPLRDVAAILSEELIGAALIRRTLIAGGTVVHPEGIVSERDISRAVAGGLDLDTAQAGDVMAVDLACADAGDTILRVAVRMLANGIRHLPVKEGDTIVGVVSERDVLGAVVQQIQNHRSGDR
jgi:signal-transduction protein with cAMP-binding, CBS, and nucleotidyltransferase domain